MHVKFRIQRGTFCKIRNFARLTYSLFIYLMQLIIINGIFSFTVTPLLSTISHLAIGKRYLFHEIVCHDVNLERKTALQHVCMFLCFEKAYVRLKLNLN